MNQAQNTQATKITVVGRKTNYGVFAEAVHTGRILRRFFKNKNFLELRPASGTFAEIGYVEYMQLCYMEYDAEDNSYIAHQSQYFDTNRKSDAVMAFMIRGDSKDPSKATSSGQSLEDIKAAAMERFEVTQFQKEHHVTISAYDIDPIPPNSNPFHYDSMSMGTELVRGWTVMHEGYDRADNPLDLNCITLVNTRTGQRIRVNLNKDNKE